MNSEQYLVKFLEHNNIPSSTVIPLILDDIREMEKFADALIQNKNFIMNSSGFDLILDILVDTYDLNSENVKSSANAFAKSGYLLGRNQKDLLKNYFDYQTEDTIKQFVENLKEEMQEDISQNFVISIVTIFKQNFKKQANELFLSNWKKATESNDRKKQRDYLLGIYTRLFNKIELNQVFLKDIFEYNYPYIVKELSREDTKYLKNRCYENNTKTNIRDMAKLFYLEYTNILKKNLQQQSLNGELESIMNQNYTDTNIDIQKYIADTGNSLNYLKTENYGLVSLNITQELFNTFKTKNDFYNYLLKTIQDAYRLLENYKVFTIKIDNILDDKKHNIKWELYSYLGIYAEHFIPIKENGNFYKPEDICADILTTLNIKKSNLLVTNLKKYYDEKIDINQLADLLDFNGDVKELEKVVDNYKYVWYGFTFVDCFSIRDGKKTQDKEIPFIKNDSELLLVFYKYRIDNRKIPCPSCGGLNISGNSFPEVGHKSWECKNIICPERSKSNRGKRYSQKTSEMQWASKDIANTDNIIEKELIKKWRKDIISIESEKDILEMIVKYYSYSNDNVLLINFAFNYDNIVKSNNRNPISITKTILNDNKNMYFPKSIKENNVNIFNDYFDNGDYIKRYLKLSNTENKDNKNIDINLIIKNKATLIEGDCYKVLLNLPNNSITSAVTSPPYYNAREYSQWSNLYLYLIDMYSIIRETFRVMKEGGVFLYNIGDISDNENTIVKSTMGEKRILLGSYIIQLFKEAGFELLDNILWNKGEPQSNRQKNDGKFSPYYQRPLNVYEHMFIFKKPGADLIISKNISNDLPINWNENIVHFSPVIKINSKGENLSGHTAPFPKDIPDFVSRVFTQNENDIVLDIFSGTLTTVISAYKNNRIGLGIELCDKYIELSTKRARNETVPLKVIKFNN